MKATTTLQVPKGLLLHINLQITVDEADALVEEMKEARWYPAGQFREVLRKSLAAARASHVADHDTSPS
jgi:hypothetical protein